MRKLIHTLLLLQTAAALNAQDVQIEGTEGEVITLVVSGFADNSKGYERILRIYRNEWMYDDNDWLALYSYAGITNDPNK